LRKGPSAEFEEEAAMPIKIDTKKCTKCGICVDHCPEDVFVQTKGKYPKVKYPDECWHCGACMIDCEPGAIHIELPLFMRLIPEPYKGEIEEPVKEY
jgi:adenylylsulfate reductase subunit B